jgi:hypothetical protein
LIVILARLRRYEVQRREWELVNVLQSRKTAGKRLEDGAAAEGQERFGLEGDWDKERSTSWNEKLPSWSGVRHLTPTVDLVCNQDTQRCRHLLCHPLGLNSYTATLAGLVPVVLKLEVNGRDKWWLGVFSYVC